MLRLALAVACLLSPLAAQDDVASSYRALHAAGDAAGLAELWVAHPDQILVTIDADLEGSLSLWEQADGEPDSEAVAALQRRAVWGARVASEATGKGIFADYASAFVGWTDEQKQRFRAGQAAFGSCRQALAAGDQQAALEAAVSCRDLALPLGDWWGAAMGLSMEGQVLAAMGRHEQALAPLGRARLLYEQLGLTGSAFSALAQLARSCTSLERFERGLASADALRAMALALDHDEGLLLAVELRGQCLEGLGRADEAAAAEAELDALRRGGR